MTFEPGEKYLVNQRNLDGFAIVDTNDHPATYIGICADKEMAVVEYLDSFGSSRVEFVSFDDLMPAKKKQRFWIVRGDFGNGDVYLRVFEDEERMKKFTSSDSLAFALSRNKQQIIEVESLQDI